MVAIAAIAGIAASGYFLIQGVAPVTNAINQGAFQALPNQIPPEAALVQSRRRGELSPEDYRSEMRGLGYSDDRAERIYKLSEVPIPPGVANDARRRGIIDDDVWSKQYERAGFTKESADRIFQQSEFYPNPQDLINWVAKEVYEQSAIDRYGLTDELDQVDPEPFRKGGLNDEQLRNYWIAHWQHPPWTVIREMLFRTDLTEEDVNRWFRLIEIPPFWRDKYTKIAYEPFTRVDVRRMWDLGVLDDGETVDAYKELGYTQEKAEQLLLFTKLFERLPELKARYRNNHIGIDDIESALQGWGMEPERIPPVLESIAKAEKPERTARQRDLTRAQVIRMASQKILTEGQARTLLMRSGYDRTEADLVLLSRFITEEIDAESLSAIPETN